ncbi:xylulokinase [Photobacterium profundum]|uniref:Xylulose kinase n=1 Tax=Photobacterium profundum (strain SS9) TaxID=298386 RepID=Q6LUX7_PHOPR|nr:xylulokinase [Photobacterium profundum]CAG18898.1 putative xylulose kinase [Photobacterium profundum SS9]
MYIGIDLGTSGVKSIAMLSSGEIVASETVSLGISRPQPLWSEQNPIDWWEATCASIKGLKQQVDLTAVQAIGLSGQMHGATLLNKQGDVLRPAILWNDGRCDQECRELEAAVPNSRDITGNIMMPGFTAPKVKWVANHEPDIFEQIDKVLLPKDYLRFKMTGDFASDLSDSAGTLWLDVNRRDWDDSLLVATGLTRHHMPALFEGNEVTGTLTPDIADQWGMSCVPVIAGGGDNAAGAIGVGITQSGQAMLSLGTSGVYLAVSDGFIANPESALHSFCHALPNTWHTMSVILSAASCLKWVAGLTGFDDVGNMIKQVETQADKSSQVIFLPYLSGERTPHNNPNAKGVFFGMTHSTTKFELALAVLEGVGFAFADGFDALHVTKNVPDEVSLIGGGARSEYWRQMLADIVGLPLVYRKGGDVGPALGAARLAMLSQSKGAMISDVCPVPEVVQRHEPDKDNQARYQAKRDVFQALYQQLNGLF